jgi:hypothetical protein
MEAIGGTFSREKKKYERIQLRGAKSKLAKILTIDLAV